MDYKQISSEREKIPFPIAVWVIAFGNLQTSQAFQMNFNHEYWYCSAMQTDATGCLLAVGIHLVYLWETGCTFVGCVAVLVDSSLNCCF